MMEFGWLFTVLFLLLTFKCRSAQSTYFSKVLTRYSLNESIFFNAAYGSLVFIPNGEENSECDDGDVLCVSQWWQSATEKVSENVQNQSSDSVTNGCSDLEIECDHECPKPVYSTPTGKLLRVYGENCDTDGKTETFDGEEYSSEINIIGDFKCTSLNFVTDFDRNAVFRLDVALNITKHSYSDERYLLLEGKLTSSTEADVDSSINDLTFFWCIERNHTSPGSNQMFLSLFTSTARSLSTWPTRLYKSVPLSGDTFSFAIQHISQPPSVTCFYLNGLRLYCLNYNSDKYRYLAFLSLMSQNHIKFGRKTLPIISGSIRQMLMYDTRAQSIISESEILSLYKDDTPEADPECKCQSPTHPLTSRFTWGAYNDSIIVGDTCLSSDLKSEESRISPISHTYTKLFDGDMSTFWVTRTGSDVTFELKFLQPLKVAGFAMVLTILPSKMDVHSNGLLISTVSDDCSSFSDSSLCLSWNTLTSNYTLVDNYPVMSWLLPIEAIVDKLTISLVNLVNSFNATMILNEFAVISTCDCQNGGTCHVDRNATPATHRNNFKCQCTETFAGPNCQYCADGLYQSEEGDCLPCGCHQLGTCVLSSGECVRENDKCDEGVCFCRSGDYFHHDETNPKCEPKPTSITPNYGPLAGSTRVTLSGDYIAAFKQAIIHSLNDPTAPLNQTVTVEERSITTSPESLIFTMPPREFSEQVNISLIPGGYKTRFIYLPNPVISSVELRNLSISGGLDMAVTGDNLNSSSSPLLTLSAFCNRALLYQTSSTCWADEANYLSCKTPNLTSFHDRCIGDGKRQKRSSESSMTYEFGFMFDGYNNYSNYSRNLVGDDQVLQVYPDPVFEPFGGSPKAIESDGTELSLTGSYLLLCCSSEDYQISVGNETCNLTSASNTQLKCLLPNSWNEAAVSTEESVTVVVGSLNLNLGTLKKGVNGVWDDDKFKAAVALSSSLTILIVIILTIWVCCVYSRHYDREANRITKLLLLKDMSRSNESNHEPSYRRTQYTINTAPREMYSFDPRSYTFDDNSFRSQDSPQEFLFDPDLSHSGHRMPRSYSNHGYYEVEI